MQDIKLRECEGLYDIIHDQWQHKKKRNTCSWCFEGQWWVCFFLTNILGHSDTMPIVRSHSGKGHIGDDSPLRCLFFVCMTGRAMFSEWQLERSPNPWHRRCPTPPRAWWEDGWSRCRDEVLVLLSAIVPRQGWECGALASALQPGLLTYGGRAGFIIINTLFDPSICENPEAIDSGWGFHSKLGCSFKTLVGLDLYLIPLKADTTGQNKLHLIYVNRPASRALWAFLPDDLVVQPCTFAKGVDSRSILALHRIMIPIQCLFTGPQIILYVACFVAGVAAVLFYQIGHKQKRSLREAAITPSLHGQRWMYEKLDC